MGTTLTNGVYLPNEGERNCYAGLKTNWEILDQKVADVTALQQAVAGALHRQIVASLPTTDIDPNTIYMVLSGTSATENVYNEFMYVNNAWELIGTSATDLTNYYTKAEVDGKLLLKANDSDVVHKSGNETIAGVKTITDTNLEFKSTSAEYGVSAGDSSVIFRDKNNLQTFKIYSRVFFSGIDNNSVSFFLTQKVNNTYYTSNGIQLLANTGNKDVILRPILANSNTDGLSVSLGASDRRWSKIYGTEYYYGSNNVEFSDKFVTTDTAQTITGAKTFNGNTNCVGELSQTVPFKMTADTSFVIGSKNTSIYDQNGFQCANDMIIYNNIKNIRRTWTVNNNNSGTTVSAGFNFILSASGQKVFYPITDGDTDNGSSSAYWKNTYTKRVNGLEPSSLSLPSDRNTRVDISSYFTNLGSGDTNYYSVSANGYIYMQLKDIVTVHCFDFESLSTTIADYIQTFSRGNDGQLYVLFPVKKDHVFKSTWYTNTTVTILGAYFIPCQGNV